MGIGMKVNENRHDDINNHKEWNKSTVSYHFQE